VTGHELVGTARLRVGIDGRVLCSPQMRGLARYTVNLLRVLSNHRNLELVLICKGEPYGPHLEGVKAKVVVGPTDREWRWHLRTLPRLIRQEAIDVYHAPADRGLPWRKVCPEVVTVHSSFERAHWRQHHLSLKHKGLYWIHEATNYMRADRSITVSATTAEELVRFRVARRSKLRVIPLAAAPEFTSEESAEDSDVLSRLGVHPPYFLFVGGYDPNKNVETVVAAFDQISDSKISLVVVADFLYRYKELMQYWRSSLRTYGQIAFVATAPRDLPALYRHALASVVSSRWESFGFPVVEAMASGTPVICSRGPALPETAGDAAIYFDPESSDELTKVMKQIIRNPALRRQLEQAGIGRAAQFSWQRVGELTERVYQEAANSSKAAG
jgi:glycosyltransferase involved in cell wall biosynthesis